MDPCCQAVFAPEIVNMGGGWCLSEPVYAGCALIDADCQQTYTAVCTGDDQSSTFFWIDQNCFPNHCAVSTRPPDPSTLQACP
jgi:hypothetical protein